MIRDVDSSLAAWLAVLAPGVPVTFGVPGDLGSDDVVTTLVLHLFDVQEEPGGGAAWAPVRDGAGRVVGRMPPQRRYRLRYLLTAAAADTLAEHELLGHVLAGCALHEVVPAAHLAGALAMAGGDVVVRCAPARGDAGPDRPAADPAEGWRATRRTTLELWVTAPLTLDAWQEAAPPPGHVELGAVRKSRSQALSTPAATEAQPPTRRVTEH